MINDIYSKSAAGLTGEYNLVNRVISFRSMSGVGSLTLNPMRDAHTKRLKGVAPLTEEDKRNMSYFVDETTEVTITQGYTLDLMDPVHSVNWQWIKFCRGIALSYEAALQDPFCHFYVYDEEAKIQQNLSHAESVYKALNFVTNSSDEELLEKARLLDAGVERYKPSRIREYMSTLAMSSSIAEVNKVINIYEDSNASEKLFLFNLLDKRVIIRTPADVYKYNDMFLGVGMEQTIAFIKDPKNRSTVEQLFNRLNPDYLSTFKTKEGSSLSQEIQKEFEANDEE